MPVLREREPLRAQLRETFAFYDQVVNVRFLKPMETVSVKRLPTGAKLTFEIKLDGFRVEAVRTTDGVVLYSRQGKILTNQFPQIIARTDGDAVARDGPRWGAGCPG